MAGWRIGPFEVEEQIGRGGMGVVYRARCVHSRQVVALKLLPDDVLPITWKRFEREINVIKTLKHPNVVYCYGGRCDDQRRYFAMEYVENGSLKELLARRGLLNWDEVVEFGLQICSALEYVHARGIVHRDLKPENLLLTADGQLKLSDFGVVLISDGRQLTREGSTCGSYGYMAPEQISGTDDLTGRADLYALGCVLFEMLTGRRVFGDKFGPPLLLEHLRTTPPSVLSFAPDCPAPLADLIASLLEKSPDKRPPDAAAVSRILQRIVSKPAPQAVNDTAVIRYAATQCEFSTIKVARAKLPRGTAARARLPRRTIGLWTTLIATGLLIGLAGWLVPSGTEPVAAARAPEFRDVANDEVSDGPSFSLIALTLLVLAGLSTCLQFLNRREAQRAAQASRLNPEPRTGATSDGPSRRKSRKPRTRKARDDASQYIRSLHLT